MIHVGGAVCAIELVELGVAMAVANNTQRAYAGGGGTGGGMSTTVAVGDGPTCRVRVPVTMYSHNPSIDDHSPHAHTASLR